MALTAMSSWRSSSFAGFMIVLGCWLAPLVAAGEWFFGQPDLQTIVVTDLTAAGRKQRQPTPDRPVYYVAVSAGYRDFGGIKAGDRLMGRAQLNRTVVKILAKQGYLPAVENRRPDIVLVWTWGTLYPETFIDPRGFTSVQVNEGLMRRFLGGAKLGLSTSIDDAFPELGLAPELRFIGGTGRNLIDTARQDLYVAVLAAYSVELNQHHHGQLLWNTRISAPSRGFWMPEALPAMLAIAGPYLGRDTAKPVWILATDRFKPDVKIGDARILDYIEKSDDVVKDVDSSK